MTRRAAQVRWYEVCIRALFLHAPSMLQRFLWNGTAHAPSVSSDERCGCSGLPASVLLDGVPLPAIDHTYLHSQVRFCKAVFE